MMWSAARSGLRNRPAVVAAALLLDGLTVTTRGAWSVRKLSGAYSGQCLRVRRNADNVEQDFGFTGSPPVLDFAAILTFIGSGAGYVTTWYDQSGAGANITQTSVYQQPQVVAGGALLALSNTAAKNTLRFFSDGNIQFLKNSSFTLGTSTCSFHTVAQEDTVDGGFARRLNSYKGSTGNQDFDNTASIVPAATWESQFGKLYYFQNSGKHDPGVVITGNTPFQVSSVFDGANVYMYADGGTPFGPDAYTAALDSSGVYRLGTGSEDGNSSSNWRGLIAESIVTSGTLSSTDLSAIRASQKTYFGTP